MDTKKFVTYFKHRFSEYLEIRNEKIKLLHTVKEVLNESVPTLENYYTISINKNSMYLDSVNEPEATAHSFIVSYRGPQSYCLEIPEIFGQHVGYYKDIPTLVYKLLDALAAAAVFYYK